MKYYNKLEEDKEKSQANMDGEPLVEQADEIPISNLEEYHFQDEGICQDVSDKGLSPFVIKLGKIVLAGSIFGLVAGTIMAGIWSVAAPKTSRQTIATMPALVTASSKEGSQSNSGVEDVVEVSMPSIVAITNKSVKEVRDFFGRGTRSYESQNAGSGIIIGENEKELLIATNYHVVEDSTTLSVAFAGNGVAQASVKGVDRSTDLAVVAVALSDITPEIRSQIGIAKIANTEDLHIGEGVVAIGNALGYGQSVTRGIVSAIREIDLIESGRAATWIQTDAAINPGNSGGALLNSKGEVIGINTIKLSREAVEGMGYAISMKDAGPILTALMNGEKIEDSITSGAYLGITGVAVSESARQSYGLPKGIYIVAVGEDTPAMAIELKKGDVIQKINDILLETPDDLKRELGKYKSGDKVVLTLQSITENGYQEEKKEVVLGDRADYQE